MSAREFDRMQVIQNVIDKRIKQRHAARQLGISPRQIRRLCRRVRREGKQALIHGLRGKTSNHRLPEATVARAVNMSASYFSEKFKVVTGINFVAYVGRTRIEKARNLLHNPNLRISEVAFEVGFQSLSQFNRAFKQVTGKAPTEYRQSLAG